MKKELWITQAEDGTILRSFLKEHLRISTRLLTTLKKKEDGILLNGERVTVRALLHTGDRLVLSVADEKEAVNPNLTPVPLSVPILYEDEDVVVCSKPAGMPTHPSHGHREDTLANALAYLYRDRPFVFRAVGRLDRETSGAIAVAKHPHSSSLLSLAMQEGRIKKEYVAWVEGVAPKSGHVTAPIRRKPDSVMLREVCEAEEGDDAETLFRLLFTDGKKSLIHLFLPTGRTHQIRVHMASIGHPLLGDGLYGSGKEGERTMLHALRLTLPLPSTGREHCFFAPPADDFPFPVSAPPSWSEKSL